MVTRDRVLEALTTTMTGAQLAERLDDATREIVPVLVDLHDQGLVARTVDNSSVARFTPLVGEAPS